MYLLKNVSTYSNGGSFESNVKEEGKYELVTLKSVDVRGNLVSSGRYIDVDVPTLKKDTLVMILSEQSPGLLGITAQIPVNEKYVLNQRVAEIQPLENIESYFLSMAINRNQRYFSERGAGTKVQNISKPNVENYEFLIPRKQEQTQIGELFQQLDRLIAQHQQKHDKLLTVKKALLEKMFPQQGEIEPAIRFKGFSDAWEEKAFSNIVTRLTSLSDSMELPRVEFEDIVSGKGLLNKNLYEKESTKTGIEFEIGDVLFGKLRPYLKNWLLPQFNGLAVGDFWVLRSNNRVGEFVYCLIQTKNTVI